MTATLLRSLCLLLAVLAVPVAAQGQQARIELESGRVIHARVLRVDAAAFEVEVDGRRTRLPRDQVADVMVVGSGRLSSDELEALVEVADRDAAADEDRADDEADDPAPASERVAGDAAARADRAGASGQEPAAVGQAGGDGAGAAQPAERVVDLIERYIWVVPSDAGYLASLGGMTLLFAALLLMLAARLAGVERVSFGRSAGLAAILLGTLTVQASLVPAQPWAMGVTLAFDFGAFWLCTALVLRARAGAAAFIVTTFAFATLLGVLLTELVAVLISARDLM